jgi:hypothetical protein
MNIEAIWKQFEPAIKKSMLRAENHIQLAHEALQNSGYSRKHRNQIVERKLKKIVREISKKG